MKHYQAWLALGLLYFFPLISITLVNHPARLTPPPDLSIYPWVYLRQGQSLNSIERNPEVILVGDILCGRGGKSLGWDMSGAYSWLRSADLALGNLECVISSRGIGEDKVSSGNDEKSFMLYGAPFQAGLLRSAGFDILGVANNHAFDLGRPGLEDTVRILGQYGIGSVGLQGVNNCEILTEFRRLGNFRIAILAFNAIPFNQARPEATLHDKVDIVSWQGGACLLSTIQAARQESNAVIVSVHWGFEYETRIDPAQREIAKQLVAAGADLVVGHHPHVPQRSEIFSPEEGETGAVVAYSLGNFIADQQFGETVNGLALRTFFDDQGLLAVQVLPLHAGLKPELLDVEHSKPFLDRFLPEPIEISFSCDAAACVEKKSQGSGDTLPQVSGLFWSGEADLTGDGLPEQIQRQADQVFVYQDGKQVWITPGSWKVVDLALGDPDFDGRQEMMMAFWRADKTGVLRSHPFLVGFREGSYHETWGGSGVSDPILELELGDVDGDGIQELVVLEQRKSGKQAVTVWDWHGWGFSLKWRSQEGNFNNLRVVPGDGQENDLIRIEEIFKVINQ